MIRTLIVDDEPDMRLLLRTLIEVDDQGLLIVGEAGSGQEALDSWHRSRPDLVLLDYQLPDMSGLEIARRIRDELVEQDIVIITAQTEVVDRSLASSLGIKAVLDKGHLFSLSRMIHGSLKPQAVELPSPMRPDTQRAGPEPCIVVDEPGAKNSPWYGPGPEPA